MLPDSQSRQSRQSYFYTQGTDEKTNPRRKLNPQQRDFYEKNGFLVIPRLLPCDLLDECRERFIDVIEGRAPKGGITLMRDITLKDNGDDSSLSQERIVNKLQEIAFDEVFSRYITWPDLLDLVENFTGPNIRAMHSMLINKPPDTGARSSRHPYHQDLSYFPFRPSERIVASWTAMERIDSANGCLCVFPGTHTGRLLRHAYPDEGREGPVNKAYFGVNVQEAHVDEAADKVELHMDKGDTVFFHPLLIHGSGPNFTQRFRKAISCHYASSDLCHYVEMNEGNENIAQELTGIAVRRGLAGISYQDLWHYKSLLVRGMEGKL